MHSITLPWGLFVYWYCGKSQEKVNPFPPSPQHGHLTPTTGWRHYRKWYGSGMPDQSIYQLYSHKYWHAAKAALIWHNLTSFFRSKACQTDTHTHTYIRTLLDACLQKMFVSVRVVPRLIMPWQYCQFAKDLRFRLLNSWNHWQYRTLVWIIAQSIKAMVGWGNIIDP